MAYLCRPVQGTPVGYAAKQITESEQQNHTHGGPGPVGRVGGLPLLRRTVAEEYEYWSRPPPPASHPRYPPLVAGWQGEVAASAVEQLARAAAAKTLGGIADRQQLNINLQVVVANDVHVHVCPDLHGQAVCTVPGTPNGMHAATPPPSSSEPFLHFHPNDPVFRPCYSPQGLDFGLKVLSRAYKAEKHVDPQYDMILYSQCPSTAETFSHTVTLKLSHKRTKQAVFVFDESVADEARGSRWPTSIHFSDMISMILQLGPLHEYHRSKVKSAQFSLYLYIIKRVGARLSQRSHHIWSNLFRWAHAHQVSSVNNANPAGSSFAQVISQAAGSGLAVIAALA